MTETLFRGQFYLSSNTSPLNPSTNQSRTKPWSQYIRLYPTLKSHSKKDLRTIIRYYQTSPHYSSSFTSSSSFTTTTTTPPTTAAHPLKENKENEDGYSENTEKSHIIRMISTKEDTHDDNRDILDEIWILQQQQQIINHQLSSSLTLPGPTCQHPDSSYNESLSDSVSYESIDSTRKFTGLDVPVCGDLKKTKDPSFKEVPSNSIESLQSSTSPSSSIHGQLVWKNAPTEITLPDLIHIIVSGGEISLNDPSGNQKKNYPKITTTSSSTTTIASSSSNTIIPLKPSVYSPLHPQPESNTLSWKEMPSEMTLSDIVKMKLAEKKKKSKKLNTKNKHFPSSSSSSSSSSTMNPSSITSSTSSTPTNVLGPGLFINRKTLNHLSRIPIQHNISRIQTEGISTTSKVFQPTQVIS